VKVIENVAGRSRSVREASSASNLQASPPYPASSAAIDPIPWLGCSLGIADASTSWQRKPLSQRRDPAPLLAGCETGVSAEAQAAPLSPQQDVAPPMPAVMTGSKAAAPVA